MNKSMLIILLIVFIVSITGFVFLVKSDNQQDVNTEEKEKFSKYDLFLYKIDPDPEATRLKALEEYKKYPPLHPERFRRKIKMLWGIDINDYPTNAIIEVGGYGQQHLTLSKKFQLMDSYLIDEDEHDLSTKIDHAKKVFPYVRAYTFINDPEAINYLVKYTDELKNKYFEGHTVQWIDEDGNGDEGVEGADFFYLIFRNALFGCNQKWIEYSAKLNSPMGLIGGAALNEFLALRLPDNRLDILNLYVKTELAKGKKFRSDMYGDQNEIYLGIDIYTTNVGSGLISLFCGYPQERGDSLNYRPWHNYSSAKGICAYLNFILQLDNKAFKKLIIQYMSGQIDSNVGAMLPHEHEELRQNIRSNNYYGYALLREFCENQMREMPTLAKIGTNFIGRVNTSKSLLLLEPFSDSFDIDTIQANESFIAYEMGHDDYYFIEIEKPVESPIAGNDGYAMILDRTEVVYGYLPKKEVIKYADNTPNTSQTDRGKQGIIEDIDGYVNIRKEPNTQSSIIGKIVTNEVFSYWESNNTWCRVKTSDGKEGYVYKNRIKAKSDTGGWSLN